MMSNDKLHLARLSIEDMNQIALTWRARAQKGDPATCAIAAAMESVVRQRRATALMRRATSARRTWAPLQRAATWAVSHW